MPFSLSQDWNKVLSGTEDGSRYKKLSTAGSHIKPEVNFCTGSSYEGQWNLVGMHGHGTYKFPHGVVYEGYVKNGMFHGNGTMTYPAGQKIDGQWVKGKMVSYKYRFSDDLDYDSPWDYCKMPDRRFQISLEEGLQPANMEFLTNKQPTDVIPQGCYDAGDGYFIPEICCVVSKNVTNKARVKPEDILRIPNIYEEAWIKKYCRSAWDEPVGYRPDLFEFITGGRRSELNVIQEIINEENTSIATDDGSLYSLAY